MADAENRKFEQEMRPGEEKKEHIRQTLLRLLADQRGMEVKGVTVRYLPGCENGTVPPSAS